MVYALNLLLLYLAIAALKAMPATDTVQLSVWPNHQARRAVLMKWRASGIRGCLEHTPKGSITAAQPALPLSTLSIADDDFKIYSSRHAARTEWLDPWPLPSSMCCFTIFTEFLGSNLCVLLVLIGLKGLVQFLLKIWILLTLPIWCSFPLLALATQL